MTTREGGWIILHKLYCENNCIEYAYISAAPVHFRFTLSVFNGTDIGWNPLEPERREPSGSWKPKQTIHQHLRTFRCNLELAGARLQHQHQQANNVDALYSRAVATTAKCSWLHHIWLYIKLRSSFPTTTPTRTLPTATAANRNARYRGGRSTLHTTAGLSTHNTARHAGFCCTTRRRRRRCVTVVCIWRKKHVVESPQHPHNELGNAEKADWLAHEILPLRSQCTRNGYWGWVGSRAGNAQGTNRKRKTFYTLAGSGWRGDWRRLCVDLGLVVTVRW